MVTVDIYYHPYLLGGFLLIFGFAVIKSLIELIP